MVEFKNFISISYIDLQKKKNFYFKKYFISDYYSFKKNPPKLSPVQKKSIIAILLLHVGHQIIIKNPNEKKTKNFVLAFSSKTL